MIHFTTYQQSSPRSANGGYRYFFNGQESDGEVYGEGGLTGYEFRQYDTRLGRWWGVDFQSEFLPGISPYSFSYNSPGYGGSMIASIVHNIQELQQYSGQSESDAMGWGDHGGGLIAIGAKQFIHEMFHGFGLRQHLTGNENEQDVLFKYGGGVHIRAIHFIDFCENILKLYNNGRFKDGIPSTYNSDFIETPSDMIEIKENEQIERKALYEQVSK